LIFWILSSIYLIFVDFYNFLDVPGARPREAPYGSIFLFTTAGDRKRQKTTLVRVQLEQHSAHRISIAARARQVFLSVCIITVLPLPIKFKNLQKLRALRARGVLLI